MLQLILRHQIHIRIVHAQFCGHRYTGLLRISGQHHQYRIALILQIPQRILRILLHRILDHNISGVPSLHSHVEHRTRLVYIRTDDILPLHQLLIPNKDLRPFKHGAHSEAGHLFHTVYLPLIDLPSVLCHQ